MTISLVRQVIEERAKLLQQLDSHPDRLTVKDHMIIIILAPPDNDQHTTLRWFRSDLEPLYKEAVEEVAAFVGAQPDNIVIIVIFMIGYNHD